MLFVFRTADTHTRGAHQSVRGNPILQVFTVVEMHQFLHRSNCWIVFNIVKKQRAQLFESIYIDFAQLFESIYSDFVRNYVFRIDTVFYREFEL
jgi:hypothetical protein